MERVGGNTAIRLGLCVYASCSLVGLLNSYAQRSVIGAPMYGKQSNRAVLFNVLNDGPLCDVSASRPVVLLTDAHHTTACQSAAGSHS